MKQRFARGLLISLCAVLPACEHIIGARFGDAEGYPADASVSSGDAAMAREAGASETPDADGAPCEPLRAPARPAGPAASDARDFVVVLRHLDFGDSVTESGAPEYLTLGYDVDGVCTSHRSGPNCVAPAWLTADLTDGPNGQDNAIGKLLFEQLQIFGNAVLTSEALSAAVDRGVDPPAAVLRISGYSGLSEDDRLTVEWFVPLRSSDAQADGGAPRFDASDAWPAAGDYVENPAAPTAGETLALLRDDAAYVTRSTLVAHFDAVVMPFKNVYFSIRDVVLTAKPETDPVTRQWLLTDGTVSARSQISELLRVIPQITSDLAGVTLCTDDAANYPKVNRFVCSAADLPAIPGDASALCLEASVGFRFDSSPASLGRIGQLPTPPRSCPEGLEPADDECSEPALDGVMDE